MVNTLTRVRVAYDTKLVPMKSDFDSKGYIVVPDLLDDVTLAEVTGDCKELKLAADSEGVEFRLDMRGFYKNLGGNDYGEMPKVIEFIVSSSKSLVQMFNGKEGEGEETIINPAVQQNRVGSELGGDLGEGGWSSLVEAGENVALEMFWWAGDGGGGETIEVGEREVEIKKNLGMLVDRRKDVKVRRKGRKGEEGKDGKKETLHSVRVWLYGNKG